MSTIKVELDLADPVGADHEGEPIALLDVIVNRAAQMLMDQIGRDDAVVSFRERVKRVQEEAIRERVVPLIDEALNRAVQPTNAYGEAKGEPVTLRERIVADATKALTKQQSHGYNRDSTTLVQDIIAKEVNRAVKDDLAKAMKAAKSEVEDAVRAKGAEVIAETLRRAVRL